MPIEGLEYETNQWDGLGKGKRPTRPPAPAELAAARAKSDPFVSTITGILDKLRGVLGWK